MKINMPVTEHEVVMQKGQTIVSKTDLKGAITYVNRDFIEISGFTEAELIGKNHNIVRHPSMPPEAFADLWFTMKQGKPWTGFVKNRCKNGDFYWVRADVAPVYENGKLIEYISVRSKPTQAQIETASNFYLNLKGNPQLLHEGVPISAFERLKRNMFGKMKIEHKLGLVGLGVLMLCLLVIGNLSNQFDAIEKLDSEIAGLSLIKQARVLSEHIPKHRGLTQALLNGDGSVVDALDDQKLAINEAFSVLDELSNGDFEVLEQQLEVRRLQASWNKLSSENDTLPPHQSFSRHSRLIEDVQHWLVSISIQSELSSDASVDINQLVPLIARDIPVLTDKVGQARGLGAGILTSQQITREQAERFIRLDAETRAFTQGLLRMVDGGDSENEGQGQLKVKAKDAVIVINEFLEDVSLLSKGDVGFSSSAIYFSNGTVAIDRTFTLFDHMAAYVATRLEDKYQSAAWATYSSIVFGVLVIAFVGCGLWFTARAIVAGMHQATVNAKRICEGDYKSDYVINSDDEIGQMLCAIKAMQIAQGFAVEDIKLVAEESLRIKNALDACSTNVMLADDDMNIIYMNSSVQQMFSEAEDDLRKDIPSFNAKSLMGANADIFHKEPSHQRGMVKALKESFTSQVSAGGRTFKLIATPVFTDEGARIGTAIEWNDRTEELARLDIEKRLAAENARIKQALDNVSANVMVADANRDIIYMNPAVIATLQNAEADIQKDLPSFDVATLLGGSIDQFHKDPTHQQRMLDELGSTHAAKIVVGGRHMALTVSPVTDDKGERLGTAVEWEDQTAEVMIQHELDELITAANSGDLDKRIGLDGKEGFFRSLSEGLNVLLDVTSGFVEDVGQVFESMADGDLTKGMRREYQGQFDQIKTNANDSMAKLNSVLLRIQGASSAVRTASHEVSQGSDDLSRRTEAQASSLEQTAASMEEINSTVTQSADNVAESNTLAEQARTKAESGGQVVQHAVTAMSEILQASNKINDIIGVIDEIAFQTNLLALNAAVEAARAGEQGKGFAVVAGEVRTLSQRSASAAKEIKDLIRDSVSKVESGSELVNQSGETLKDIVQAVDEVAVKIQDVASAATEQMAGIGQINQAINQMDSMTQQNAALVEETTAASRSMSEEAGEMNKMISFFKMQG